MSVAYTLVLNAAVATLVLALAAVGLAVIFGMMNVINLAHGAFITGGAYVAWVAANAGSFWAGVIAAPIVLGVVGYVLEWAVVGRLYDRPLDTILATWGIALAAQEGLKLLFDATSKDVPLPIQGRVDLGATVYPTYRLVLIGMSAVVLTAVFAVLLSTKFGVRLRAVIQDPTAASLLGLNETRLYRITFASGAGLAGLAGAVLSPIATVTPEMGTTYLIDSFLAVIIGGSPVGVVLGSAVVAGTGNLLSFAVSPVTAQTVVFVVAIAVVVVRPEGIVGE
ncbi:MAG: branched-chain amino acid ABC-type transport system, permease component [halophilic archaeon J07HX5]|nr:MAG: branched-chain amino acid ABC-type transport system, permease component [halophilic archaeon J07HX5]